MSNDIFNGNLLGPLQIDAEKIGKIMGKQFDMAIMDTLLDEFSNEENKNEDIKKRKLTHKTFRNILDLEEFINKRKISSSRIINVQFIQTGFSGYYELIYFK